MLLRVNTLTRKMHSMCSLQPSFKIVLDRIKAVSYHVVPDIKSSLSEILKINDLHLLNSYNPYWPYPDDFISQHNGGGQKKCLVNLPSFLYLALCLGRLSIMGCINWVTSLSAFENDLTKQQKQQEIKGKRTETDRLFLHSLLDLIQSSPVVPVKQSSF